MIGYILYFISLTFLFGESETPLDIWMEDKILNNRKLNWWGVWEVEYRGYKYTTVNYKTEPQIENPAYYFRPWKTMLARTVADGGQSFYVQGAHLQTIPALWTAINSLHA